MNFGDIFVPALMVFILCYGLVKKVDIVNVFCEGATENLKIAVGLIPMLILLMTAVGMFTSSGAADIIAKLLRPVTTFLGFPEECIPLAIVRPISGSGALACLETILSSVSPDSYSGRVASVLMGSTETTFYTIAAKSLPLSICSGVPFRPYGICVLCTCSKAVFLIKLRNKFHISVHNRPITNIRRSYQ